MDHSISIGPKQVNPLLIVCLFVALCFLVFYLIFIPKSPVDLISGKLSDQLNVSMSNQIISEAIVHAAKSLGEELDIELGNYDLSLEQYRQIVKAAEQKFGDCHQYRLIPLFAILVPSLE